MLVTLILVTVSCIERRPAREEVKQENVAESWIRPTENQLDPILLYKRKCGQCHIPYDKYEKKYHGRQWKPIVERMFRLETAQMTDEQAEIIYRYLYDKTKTKEDVELEKKEKEEQEKLERRKKERGKGEKGRPPIILNPR